MEYQIPFGQPFNITAKPTGSLCNLRCDYCYYLEKKELYTGFKNNLMNDETLENFIRSYIASQPTREVVFNWHGGEALLRPLSFYRKILSLQEKYGIGRKISNTIQTNGTLLTDEWANFFSREHWLVGLSIDGPVHLHDTFRKKKDGKGSFSKVMKGIDLLNKYDVDWNILATVNSANSTFPIETYEFLKNLGTPFLQFTPVVERIDEKGRLLSGQQTGIKVTDFSVSPSDWGNFMIAVFDEWVRKDVGEVFVQLFDATLANLMKMPSPVCTMAEKCGNALALEFNGDIYVCDHFVFPQYRLGNILNTNLWQFGFDSRKEKFGNDKKDKLPKQCRECDVLWGCHGECPRNRFIPTDEEDQKLNYLCEGYKKFLHHANPYMTFMKEMLDQKKAPALIMEAIKNGLFTQTI